MEFKLQAEFGELDNALKAMGLVASELRFPPKARQGDAEVKYELEVTNCDLKLGRQI